MKIACHGDGRLIGVKRARLEMRDIEYALNTLARISFDIDVPFSKLLGEYK